jgi:hypothetical protein
LKKSGLVLLVSAIAVLAMLVTSCTQPQPTPTPTPTPIITSTPTITPTPTPTPTPVQVGDKKYNALSPRGVQLPVTIQPLAARLDTIDGKTIYVVQGEADPVIMPALNDYLQKTYPKTKWIYYQPSSSFGPNTPDATTLAEAKAIIRGIAW